MFLHPVPIERTCTRLNLTPHGLFFNKNYIDIIFSIFLSKQTKGEKEPALTPPFASAMAIIAAASITHERGFHINPKNFKNLLS